MKLMRSSLNKKGGFTKGLSRYSGISTFNMILIILFGIFLIVYSYRYAYNYINKNSTYIDNGSSGSSGSSGNSNDDIKLILFYADWCPHCKAIKNANNTGEWDLFRNEHNDDEYIVDGKTIKIYEHEADDNNNKIIPNNYNIKGYPSIVLDINGKHYHYETKITKNRLEEFVKQTLTYKPTIIDKIISFISFTN